MNKINKAIQVQTNFINPFDINKAKHLAQQIKTLDKRLNLVVSEEDIEFRNTFLCELKEYCSTYGKDYSFFYNREEYNNYSNKYYNVLQAI
jgi:hypothetical protein